MSDRLTHVDEDGVSTMVDVGDKPVRARRALARALLVMRPETLRMIVDGAGPKGEVLAVARVAGIQAAKATSSLIPMCHPIAISACKIEFHANGEGTELEVLAEVRSADRTGVEMEAMTAASIASLTIYDMVKAVDRELCVRELMLVHKSGGKSGTFDRDGHQERA